MNTDSMTDACPAPSDPPVCLDDTGLADSVPALRSGGGGWPEVPDPESAPRTRRVLHVINGEHYAGAERVQDLLARRLPECGWEVGFACLKSGEFALVRRCRTAPLYPLGMRNRLDLRPAWRIARIVRAQGYELIHAHTPRSAMIAALAARLAGVPLVYHVHSPVSRDTTHWLKNTVNSWIERISVRRASALIAVSESLGRYIGRRRGVAGKLSVVPNGVPSPASAGESAEKSPPVRFNRSSEARPFTLGVVALFRPRKGVEVLLDALARLRDRGHPVRLRAIGGFESSQYEGQIKALANQLGVADLIDWVGFTEDVDAELARVDALVLPSLFGEGLPMVILEAMAAGLPVVATRVEGVPEAVRDGVDGVIAEPGDARSLADSISRMATGEIDLTAMGRNAAERHRERFSDLAMARGVAEIYRRVLDSV